MFKASGSLDKSLGKKKQAQDSLSITTPFKRQRSDLDAQSSKSSEEDEKSLESSEESEKSSKQTSKKGSQGCKF